MAIVIVLPADGRTAMAASVMVVSGASENTTTNTRLIMGIRHRRNIRCTAVVSNTPRTTPINGTEQERTTVRRTLRWSTSLPTRLSWVSTINTFRLGCLIPHEFRSDRFPLSGTTSLRSTIRSCSGITVGMDRVDTAPADYNMINATSPTATSRDTDQQRSCRFGSNYSSSTGD